MPLRPLLAALHALAHRPLRRLVTSVQVGPTVENIMPLAPCCYTWDPTTASSRGPLVPPPAATRGLLQGLLMAEAPTCP